MEAVHGLKAVLGVHWEPTHPGHLLLGMKTCLHTTGLAAEFRCRVWALEDPAALAGRPTPPQPAIPAGVLSDTVHSRVRGVPCYQHPQEAPWNVWAKSTASLCVFALVSILNYSGALTLDFTSGIQSWILKGNKCTILTVQSFMCWKHGTLLNKNIFVFSDIS